jgi:uncharacterized protein
MEGLYSFKENGELFTYNITDLTVGCDGYVEAPVISKEAGVRNDICRIKFMSLHVAHECPLYCEYCYGSGGEYDTPCTRMSSATMKQAVDYLFRYCTKDKNVHINFFGGEPLLAFELIKECVAYSEEKAEVYGKTMEYSVSTSALVLNDEILDFISQHHFSVSVSIDGTKYAHDRHRKFRNNNESYDKVVEGFKRLAERNKKILITATLTHHTIDEIGEYQELLSIGADNFRFKTVTGMTSDLKLSDKDYDKLSAKYECLAKTYLNDILNGKVYDFGDFTKWIHRLNKKKSVRFNCTATEDYVNVDPYGEIYICHKYVGVPDGRLGNVYQIDTPIKPLNFDAEIGKCKYCWAHNLCGGGCYYDGYEATGNSYHTCDTNKCKIHRAQIKAAIYIYYHLKEANLLDQFLESITSSTNSYQLTV